MSKSCVHENKTVDMLIYIDYKRIKEIHFYAQKKEETINPFFMHLFASKYKKNDLLI